MSYILPPLPFNEDALSPYLSKETLQYHYGQHHKNYVVALNKLLEQEAFKALQSKSLEEIIKLSPIGSPIFNNAAQIWNHNFYWNSLSEDAHKRNESNIEPSLKQAIEKQFGSMEQFKEAFSTASLNRFGSGWVWLIKEASGTLQIETTANAETPIRDDGKICLLTCDVWEHAYYIDYRNRRAEYLKNFWPIVNWHFVSENWKI